MPSQATIQEAWKLILWSKSFGQYLKCTDAIPLKVKLKYKLGAEHNTYCISWNIFILVLITNDKTTDKSCNPVNPQQFYSHLKHFLLHFVEQHWYFEYFTWQINSEITGNVFVGCLHWLLSPRNKKVAVSIHLMATKPPGYCRDR